MTAFIVIGVVGVVVLILSMVLDGFDELFGILDVGDGIFSLTALGSAAALAGAVGVGVLSLGGAGYLAIGLASVIALLTLFGVGLAVRRLKRSTKPAQLDVVGLKAITTELTTPEIGEVRIEHPSEINKRLAHSTGAPIPAGTPVKVVAVDGSRVVVVRDYDEGWQQPPRPEDDPSGVADHN